jgi:dihydrofolate reductase
MTRIIYFGDSITQGHELGEDQRWTSRLAQALPRHEIINRGIDGDTTALALDRVVAGVLPLIIAGTVVLLEFGLNDANHHPGRLRPRASLGEFLANLDELVTLCSAAGATCVLIANHRVSQAKEGQGNGLSRQDNVGPYHLAIRELAKSRALTCIDIADAVARHGYDAAELLHPDGVHLTPDGNALYARLIHIGLAPLLSARQPLALVAAMARNRVIGNQGQLPWHEPADLAHFKRITTGHAVIMGRKTWESLGRPLPRRRNLVVTRQSGFTAPGIEVHATLDSAIAAARATDPEPHVIGGGEIYALALHLATRIELTEIATDTQGDAWFPVLDANWSVALERALTQCVFRTWIPAIL